MLLNLFNEMRAAKVPVSVRELLDLHRHSADLVLAVSALQKRVRQSPPSQVRGLAARRGIAA